MPLVDEVLDIVRSLKSERIEVPDVIELPDPEVVIREDPETGRKFVSIPGMPAALIRTPLVPAVKTGFFDTMKRTALEYNSATQLYRAGRRLFQNSIDNHLDEEYLEDVRTLFTKTTFFEDLARDGWDDREIESVRAAFMGARNYTQATLMVEELLREARNRRLMMEGNFWAGLAGGLVGTVMDPSTYLAIGTVNKLARLGKLGAFMAEGQKGLGFRRHVGFTVQREMMRGASITAAQEAAREFRDFTIPAMDEITYEEHLAEMLFNSVADAGLSFGFSSIGRAIRNGRARATELNMKRDVEVASDATRPGIAPELFVTTPEPVGVLEADFDSRIPDVGPIDIEHVTPSGTKATITGQVESITIRNSDGSADIGLKTPERFATVHVDEDGLAKVVNEVNTRTAGEPLSMRVDVSEPSKDLLARTVVVNGEQIPLPDRISHALAVLASGQEMDPVDRYWLKRSIQEAAKDGQVLDDAQLAKLAAKVREEITSRQAQEKVVAAATEAREEAIAARRVVSRDVTGQTVEGQFEGVTRDPQGRPIAIYEGRDPVRITEAEFRRLDQIQQNLPAMGEVPPLPERPALKIPRGKGGPNPEVPAGFRPSGNPRIIIADDIVEPNATAVFSGGNQRFLREITVSDVARMGERSEAVPQSTITDDALRVMGDGEVSNLYIRLANDPNANPRTVLAVDRELHRRAIERRQALLDQDPNRPDAKRLKDEIKELRKDDRLKAKLEEGLETLKPRDFYLQMIEKVIRADLGTHLRALQLGIGPRKLHESAIAFYDRLAELLVYRMAAAASGLFDQQGRIIGDAAIREQISGSLGQSAGPLRIAGRASRRRLETSLGLEGRPPHRRAARLAGREVQFPEAATISERRNALEFERRDAIIAGDNARAEQLTKQIDEELETQRAARKEIRTGAQLAKFKQSLFDLENTVGGVTRTLTVDSKRNPTGGPKITGGFAAGDPAASARTQNELMNRLLSETRFLNARSWRRLLSRAFDERQILMEPGWTARVLGAPDVAVEKLARLTNAQRRAADAGIENVMRLREAMQSGLTTPVHSAKLIIWGMLSRMTAPFVQESAFVDLMTQGMDDFIRAAHRGEFDVRAYDQWVKGIMQGPGRGAGQNVGGISKKGEPFGVAAFLQKISDDPTKLDQIHAIFTDYSLTSLEVRQKFFEIIQGSGIQAKVLSFIMLASGRTDTFILDRIAARVHWNSEELFGGMDLYNIGVPGTNKNVGIAKELNKNLRSLYLHAIMEKALGGRIPDDVIPRLAGRYKRGDTYIDYIYRQLGREGEGSIGRLHWDLWLIESNQAVDHSSLRGLADDIFGKDNPYADLIVQEGTQDALAFGARFVWVAGMAPRVLYPDSKGKLHEFEWSDFHQFIQDLKKARFGVVRKDVVQKTEDPYTLKLSTTPGDRVDIQAHPEATRERFTELRDPKNNRYIIVAGLDRLIKERSIGPVGPRVQRAVGRPFQSQLPGSAGLGPGPALLTFPPMAGELAMAPPSSVPHIQADAAVDGDRLVLIHRSDRPDLTRLDPETTLGGGTESLTMRENDARPSAYLIVDENGDPLQAERIYDMWEDPLGVRRAAESFEDAEARLKDLGFAGYWFSDYPGNEVLAGQARVFRGTDVKPLEHEGATVFTKQTDQLTRAEAEARADGKPGQDARRWVRRLHEKTGIQASSLRTIIGVWGQSAEDGFVGVYGPNIDPADVTYLAAVEGMLMNRNASLVFRMDPQGTDRIYSFEVSGRDSDSIARSLEGIDDYVLERAGDLTTVHVVDRIDPTAEGPSPVAISMHRAMEILDGQSPRTRSGYAETLGPDVSGFATDSSARDAAQRFFGAIINEHESVPGNIRYRPDPAGDPRILWRRQAEEQPGRRPQGPPVSGDDLATPGRLTLPPETSAEPTSVPMSGLFEFETPIEPPPPKPPGPTTPDPDLPAEEVVQLQGVDDILMFSGADAGSVHNVPRQARALELERENDVDVKLLANWLPNGWSRLLRYSRLFLSRSLGARLWANHAWINTVGPIRGILDGTFDKALTLEEIATKIRQEVTEPVDQQVLIEAMSLGSEHVRAVQRRVGERTAGNQLQEQFPIIQEVKERFRSRDRIRERGQDLSWVAELIRAGVDSVDDANFKAVFDTMPTPIQNHIRSLAAKYELSLDDFAPHVQRIIDAQRKVGKRSALNTAQVAFFDALFVVNVRENARVQHLIQAAHIFTGKEGAPPAPESPEADRLLRHILRLNWLPDDWQTRIDDPVLLDEMRTFINREVQGNLGRAHAKAVLNIIGDDGTPVFRPDILGKNVRYRALMKRLAGLQKLRIMEATVRAMGLNIAPIKANEHAPNIVMARFTTDIDEKIGDELRARIREWVNFSERNRDLFIQTRGDEVSSRGKARLVREIGIMEEAMKRDTGLDPVSASAMAYEINDTIQNFTRAFLLEGVQLAQLVGDTGLMLARAISYGFSAGVPALIRASNQAYADFRRLTREEAGDAAPILASMEVLFSYRMGKNARLLMDSDSPMNADIIHQRELWDPEKGRNWLTPFVMDPLNSVSRSMANLATIMTSTITQRQRQVVYEYHRIRSTDLIKTLARGYREDKSPREILDNVKVDKRLAISMLEYLNRNQILELDRLLKNDLLYTTVKRGPIDITLPTGMALLSSDPEISGLAKKLASARATREREDLSDVDPELLARFESTVQTENALHSYASWLNQSISETIITPHAANRFVFEVHPALRTLVNILSFANAWDDFLLRSITTSRKEAVAALGGMIGASFMVWLIRGWLSGRYEERRDRALENPEEFIFERLAWGGTFGLAGEMVGHMAFAFLSPKERDKLRVGLTDRGMSIPFTSAASATAQNMGSFFAALDPRGKGITEKEFKRMWSFFSPMEAAPFVTVGRLLQQFGVPGFDDAHPMRDIAMYSGVFRVRPGATPSSGGGGGVRRPSAGRGSPQFTRTAEPARSR